jgi:hypothetical protein
MLGPMGKQIEEIKEYLWKGGGTTYTPFKPMSPKRDLFLVLLEGGESVPVQLHANNK